MSPEGEPTTGSTPATPRRRRLIVTVAVGVVVVVAVVVALVLTGRGDGGPSTDDTASTSQPTGDAPGSPADPSSTDAPTSTTPPAAGPDTPESPPVGLDESPTVVDGVTVRVKSLDGVDGEAVLPGEVSGPAVRAELEVYNGSAAPVDLSTVVVNLAYGTGRTPANTFSTGTSSFPASVAAGTTATGVYVFSVPADAQDDLRLTFDYAVDVPVVVFEGSTS
ncbi:MULTISPECIES: hypothetical protein [unclassified Frigoribacterium]|jgi:hypothetical protein|uniref:hypothetical protein n=1 Tax=unclassified Frigoribacterium TaxID=2627005 RepID=UPI0005B99BFB|nr:MULTISPECIES: hypothetical protein [unclassified Frigoribacterium]KIU03958.1 hypothetical protein SZ60_02230 [Frigoribacterium sp. MEB024]KQN41460.1 hypothetical protein ASE87_11410 [Frigoribacterium sp. Leaf44]